MAFSWDTTFSVIWSLDEIKDRSDLQADLVRWPSPQVPTFLLKSEQPSDLRMTRGDDE